MSVADANFGDMAAHVLYDWGVSCWNVGGGLRLDLHVWTRGRADRQSRSAFWQNEPKRKNAVNSMWLPARGVGARTPVTNSSAGGVSRPGNFGRTSQLG
jgi:hypothetical protein